MCRPHVGMVHGLWLLNECRMRFIYVTRRLAIAFHGLLAAQSGGKWQVASCRWQGGKVAGAANSPSHYLKLLLCITQRKLIMIISLLNATSTYRCPSSHTHRHTQLGVCVCVCVLAIVLIPCLQLISHDFIHVYSKKKLFNAFKCKQNAHSHSHSYSHSHCHSHSLRVIHSRICAQLRIHTFILELSSFIPSLSVAFSFPHPSFHVSISPRLLLLLLAASYLLK